MPLTDAQLHAIATDEAAPADLRVEAARLGIERALPAVSVRDRIAAPVTTFPQSRA
jgi:hypothetical protein